MQITSGKIPGPQKVLIYGPEGIGKSTLAALFPDPVFIDVEGSTKHMDVKRLPDPSSWTMLMEAVSFVAANPGTCKTLVIDTADWAEALCIAHVCAKAQMNGIEDFGYGKGYTYLAEEFGNLLNRLSDVIDAGVHVVLTAHSQIRKFEQPDEAAAYDRWELKLQKKTAPLVREWCDMVLFVNYKTMVVKSEKTKTTKGVGGRERVAYSTHAATWDAKNRHDLPDIFPIGDGKALPPELAAAIAFQAPSLHAAPTSATPADPPASAPVQAPTPEQVECFFSQRACASQVDHKCTAAFTCSDHVSRAEADSSYYKKSGTKLATEAFGEPERVIPHEVVQDELPTTCPCCDLPDGKHDEESSLANREPRLKALYDLMGPAGVTEADIRRVVADKGYFPEKTALDVYPQDFVDGVLVAAWPQVLARINELKELDSVPFK